MATNQLMPAEWNSVFGPSALDVRKTQDEDFQNRTRLNAQLDPMAMNYNSSVNMGRTVGQGINSLFGLQSRDPALRRAETMDSIFKTLSPEELKNPAMALSTIADRLEEQGLPRDAAEARMKSTQLAQQTMLNENQVKDSNNKKEQASLERVAKGASAIYNMYDQAAPELQEQLYNQQVTLVEKEFGTEAANQLRSVKPSERKLMLRKMVDEADKESTRSKEDIAQEKISAAQKAYEFKASVQQALQTERENNDFILQANDLRYKGSQAYLSNLEKRVAATDKALKNQADLLAMYSDPMKTPTLTESERVVAINQITENMSTLQSTKAKLNTMQGSAGQAVQNPVLAGPGSVTGTKGQVSSKTEYDTDFATVQAALKNPKYNSAAILADFKAKYPNQPQPTGSTTATTSVTPATQVAAPAAVVPPKPKLSVEEQKKADFEAAFLAKLNQETDWQKIGNAGKVVYNAINDFWLDYKDDLKAQGELTDKFAAYAKEKLADKTFVARLGPNAKAKLEALAADSSTKLTERQQEGAQTMLTLGTLVLGSGIAMPTAKGIIKAVAGKAAKSTLKKENDAIPSSASAIEKNMETLKQTLLNKSEGARIAKLRSLGYKAEEAAKILKEMNLPIAGRSSKTGKSVLMQDTQKVSYTKPLFN